MSKATVRREELLAQMVKILNDHKDDLLKLKIKVSVAVQQCEKCPDTEELGRIQHASTWLGKFFSGPLREYRIAYAYHSEEEWTMLSYFDGDQEEEVILKESLKALKDTWRKRPGFFKKPVKKKKEKDGKKSKS